MLVTRTFSSIVLIAAVAASLAIDWVNGLVTVGFIILGLHEFFSMLEHKGIQTYRYFGTTMGAIIPLSIILRFEPTKSWEFLFIVLALLFLIIMQFKRRDHSGVVVAISTTIFGILYVSWFASFMIKIRFMPAGLGFLSGLLIITKLGDIGAYLIGSRFGRRPLIPHISPKKSVEGSIGGLVFSVLASFGCNALSFLPFPYVHVFFIGIALGVLGQLGDLSESLMKRDCKIKDSSDVIPGIGGVLDLIDSLLFTAPAFYFYLSLVLK